MIVPTRLENNLYLCISFPAWRQAVHNNPVPGDECAMEIYQMQTKLKKQTFALSACSAEEWASVSASCFWVFFSSADCTFYTNNDFFKKKQKQLSFKDQSLWRCPQHRADGWLMDAFLCFMLFPSIFQENGILMNDCCINLGWRSTWWCLSTGSSNSHP